MGRGTGAPLEVIAPDNPLAVPAGKAATTTVFVTTSREGFAEGQREVSVRVSDGAGWTGMLPYRLLGPEGHARGDERSGGERREK